MTTKSAAPEAKARPYAKISPAMKAQEAFDASAKKIAKLDAKMSELNKELEEAQELMGRLLRRHDYLLTDPDLPEQPGAESSESE